MKTFGKLYGVGVGPGATDLITLRGVNVLNKVDVLGIPRSSEKVRPFAWRVCKPVVKENPSQEKLFLHFPMTKDHRVLIPAWKKAFDEIYSRLKQGLDLAFITQGDPSVYSSWMYILDEFSEKFPQIEIEIVPGVSSITAVPAVLKKPLADGKEQFCVLPATYGIADLPQLCEHFDTIILTKVGRMIPQLVEVLERLNLLDQATYVSYATTEDQIIVEDIKSIKNDSCAYFSMVQISIRRRKGVLWGRQEGKQQEEVSHYEST